MALCRADKGERVAELLETRDLLTRILIANDAEVLARLRLSAAEAARVCNVTPRQLIYWTKKGLVKASADGDHDYDVYAMEKVIRIRQSLAKGYSLEKAAQLVNRDIASLQGEVKRLDDMPSEDLEDELRRRLERLEERVAILRRSLPASLSLARLRRATAELARMEEQGTLQTAGATGEGAKALVLRLGRAVDELEMLLREVQSAAV
jgi:DNA-binding transcriptional MerR regulator